MSTEGIQVFTITELQDRYSTCGSCGYLFRKDRECTCIENWGLMPTREHEYRRGARDCAEVLAITKIGRTARKCKQFIDVLADALNDLLQDGKAGRHRLMHDAVDMASERLALYGTGNRKRFAILKRDGFRCQLCGASAKDGTELHIDHKIPRSSGGSDHHENLWTLCAACNAGKSDDINWDTR